ncbi:hypothetical protein FVER14953_11949 [Fusarium verticillioides]|nr:hypothetical protein FVER14953_11949 [Fusarium verticillioides]
MSVRAPLKRKRIRIVALYKYKCFRELEHYSHLNSQSILLSILPTIIKHSSFKLHPILKIKISAPNTQKTLLIFGATGKQGGAVIDNILSNSPDSPFHIIAVTRDATTRKAQALAANPNVSVIEGDLDNVGAIFAKAGPVWGVYSVQINSEAEERQGKAVINAAVQHGAQRFVYSSGDRGGPERSPNNPTYVKNFAAKYAIEKHLEQQARDSIQQMAYTILRPRMGSKKLQMVSTKDIGWFAAQSLMWPEMYKNMALTLVGDELTQREADAIYYEVIGQKMALAPCPVASAVKFVLKGSVGDMFKWFTDEGYGGDVQECRAYNPGMQDFRAWLEENKGTFENDSS